MQVEFLIEVLTTLKDHYPKIEILDPTGDYTMIPMIERYFDTDKFFLTFVLKQEEEIDEAFDY